MPEAWASALLNLHMSVLLEPPNFQQQHSFFPKSEPSPTHTLSPVQHGHMKKLTAFRRMSTPIIPTVTTVPGAHDTHVSLPDTVHSLSFPWKPFPAIAQAMQKLMVLAALSLARACCSLTPAAYTRPRREEDAG
jgi:hypothetical protein